MQDDPEDGQVKRMLNIIMTFAYDSSMHNVCVNKEGKRTETTGPENKGSDAISFAIPMVDGAIVSYSGPMGAGVTHNTKYTLHFGE